MKKALLTLSGIVFGFCMNAQVLVSTDPQPKNVILEEFTGIHCQYCPEGHAISQALMDNNPGRVFPINVHQGSYATPSGSDPDYRTAFGDALAAQTGLSGYPSGTVNRHVFPTHTTTALDRGSWGASADVIMAQTSPVNVGVASQYNSVTRQLTITVELYYTSSGGTAPNRINVALVQDSIIGPQQTTTTLISAYTHMHMLRYLITGQWGDTVSQVSAGSLVTRTYTYVVPANYTNIPCLVENCKIAVFVAQGQQEIFTGVMVPAIGGTNKYIGKMLNPGPIVKAGTTGNNSSFTLNALNGMTVSDNFLLTLTSTNLPADWTAGFTVDAVPYTTTATISLSPGVPKAIVINVTPGTTPALPTFKLSMKSVSNPMAPEKFQEAYVIANVYDLVIDGTGGNETLTYDSIYINGLVNAGDVHHTSTSGKIMAMGVSDNAFGAVHNIWANISWTFPALKDAEALALKSFLNTGGRLLIAGQDVGWDIMSNASGSNGDSITQDFYTNYLHTAWVADGSSTNSQLVPSISDPIFANVGSSAITNPFGGSNMYPDQINPSGTGASSIFYYNGSASLSAGVRAQVNNYKIVNLGIGLEMVGNKTVKNKIVKEAYDWFWDVVSTNDFDNNMAELLGQNFPNPAVDYTVIPFNDLKEAMILEITDLSGRMILKQAVVAGSTSAKVNTAGMGAGLYLYSLKSGTKLEGVKKLSVIH